MTVYNLGSINVDLLYSVPHLPTAGETLAAHEMQQFLGGKGANISVAAARAGAEVRHIGAVGQDGGWTLERLNRYGVRTDQISTIDAPTGHAIIAVDPEGENLIILLGGANQKLTVDQVISSLTQAEPGDFLVLQNETNAQGFAARRAHERGLKVCYVAAPFDVQAVEHVLPHSDILILNAVEAEQLEAATGQNPDALPVQDVIVTLGAEGVRHYDNAAGHTHSHPAHKVPVLDTTGAGDTFAGYLVAGLDQGMTMAEALAQAQIAAALMVGRTGTADVIPTLSEVNSF